MKIKEISLDQRPRERLKESLTKIRGILIGRDSRNLKETESIAKRYFPLQSIKVIW